MKNTVIAFRSAAIGPHQGKDLRDMLALEDFGFLRLTCMEVIHRLPVSDPRTLPFERFQNYLDRKVDMTRQEVAAILDKFFVYYNFGAHNDKYAPDAPERVYSHMALKWVAEIAQKLQPSPPRAKAGLIKFTARDF